MNYCVLWANLVHARKSQVAGGVWWVGEPSVLKRQVTTSVCTYKQRLQDESSYSFNIKLNFNHFVVKNAGAVGRRRFDRSAHLTIWALHLLRSSLECVECSPEQRRELLSLHLSDRPPHPQCEVHIQVQVCGPECFYLRISVTQIHPSIPSTDEPTQDIRLRQVVNKL